MVDLYGILRQIDGDFGTCAKNKKCQINYAKIFGPLILAL